MLFFLLRINIHVMTWDHGIYEQRNRRYTILEKINYNAINITRLF